MLSMTLDPIEGHKIGEHPLIVQLLKGCCNVKPPQPRYNSLWDPEVVISYFSSLGPNDGLSLTLLSRKLAMLLELATISRVAEICSILYKSIKFSSSAVSFSFSRLKKSQHTGPLQSYVLQRFEGLNCPVACLEAYLSATKDFRTEDNGTLFLSVRRPHKTILSSTLGHWLKASLKDAGFDEFSAHSVRDTAASSA